MTANPGAATPRTDALIESAPFAGPKVWVEQWDKAVDSHHQLERELAEANEKAHGYYCELATERAARAAAEGALQERDKDWVLAMGHALGLDSGYFIPIVPTVEAFKKLFDAIRRPAPSAGMVMVQRDKMEEIISALDRGLGDTDITHLETDEEIREQAPIQWACTQLSLLLQAAAPLQPGAGEEGA